MKNIFNNARVALLLAMASFALPATSWAVVDYTGTDYEAWSYSAGCVVWRATSGQLFHASTVADVAADGTIGDTYTLNTSDHPWQVFCRGLGAYTAPGKVLVFDEAGYNNNSDAQFVPLSFGGLWVKALQANGAPYCITDNKTDGTNRQVELGATDASTYFKFDESFTFDRNSATKVLGTATVEIADGKTFTINARANKGAVVEAGNTLVLKGEGKLAVVGGLAVSGTLDLSAATCPTIVGYVTLDGDPTLVFPAGTEFSEDNPFEVCTELLSPSGLVNVKIGDGEIVSTNLCIRGGAIIGFSSETQYAELTYEGDYPTIVPANLTFKFVGGDTEDTAVHVPAVTVYGTLKTSGYIVLEDLTVASSASLEVQDGNTTVGCSLDCQLKGNITIDEGATLTNTKTDTLDWTGSMTVDIHGTLAMGNTRWSVPETCRLNLYEGAAVTGVGDEFGVFDFMNWWGSANRGLDLYGGTVTIEGQLRVRNMDTRFWIAEGATLILAGGIRDGLSNSNCSIRQVGLGTMEVHKNSRTLHGGSSSFTQGTLRLVDTTLAFPVELQSANSYLEIVATDADTTVPVEISCIDYYHNNNNITFSGEGKVSGSITKKQAPGGTLATFLQSEHWTGTFVADWEGSSSSRFDINSYGNANSIVEVMQLDGGYVTDGSVYDYIVVPTVKVSGTMTLDNGYSGKTTTFTRLTGSGDVVFKDYTCNIITLDEFTGTLTHNTGARIGTINLSSTPLPGERIVRLGDDAVINSIEATNVSINGVVDDTIKLEIRSDGIYVADGEDVPTESTSVSSKYSTYSVTSSSAGNSNIEWQSFKLNADNWIYCTSDDDIAETASMVQLDSVKFYWGSGTHGSAYLGYPGDTSDSYIVLTTTNDVVVGVSNMSDAKWTANGSTTYTFEDVTISPSETYCLHFELDISDVSIGGTLSRSLVSARVACVWHGSSQSSATGDEFVRTSSGNKFSAKCDISVSSLATIKLVDGTATLADTPYNDGLGDNENGRYRIPAIAKSTDGVVVALYDCRYNNDGDLPNQIDLAESWSGDQGDSWSFPRIGIDVDNTSKYGKQYNLGDPCILFDPIGNKFWAMGITGGGLRGYRYNGEIISDVVLYTRGTGKDDAWQPWTEGPEGNERSVKQMILNSLAVVMGDASYADEDNMVGILQGPGHGMVQQKTVYDSDGKTVLMPAGALVFPMQYFPTSDFNDAPLAFAVYSTDHGSTWNATKLTQSGYPAQENCVMELDDGTWYMICKGRDYDTKENKRQLFRSTDYKNWTYCGELTPSEWVQGSCLKLGQGIDGKGRYAACFTVTYRRQDLTLHFGRDTTDDPDGNGIEWDCGTTNIYPGTTGNMSYNSLVMLDDKTLGVLFESKGHIELLTVDVSDILASGAESDTEWVAKIGETYYGTMQAAIAEYNEGDVIELQSAVTNLTNLKIFNRTCTFAFKIDETYMQQFISFGCISGYKFNGAFTYDDNNIYYQVVEDTGIAKVISGSDGTFIWYQSAKDAFTNANKGDSILVKLDGDLAVDVSWGSLATLDTITFETETSADMTVTTFCKEPGHVAYFMAASNWVAPENVTLKLYSQTVKSVAAGTVEIPEKATVTLESASAFDSVGRLIGPGMVSIAGTVPSRSSNLATLLQNSSWNGTFILGALDAISTTEVPLEVYGNENSFLTLKGVSGKAWCARYTNTVVQPELTLNGYVNFQDGYSRRNVTFRKIVAGTGNLSLKTWNGCVVITYGFDELNADNYTGTIQLDGTLADSDGDGLIFNVGNILKMDAKRGEKVLNLTAAGKVTVNLDNATLNGEATDFVLEDDGLYLPLTFDPDRDTVAETCVLRISEIMPKPTDSHADDGTEKMDVNGLESGWVEVENTSATEWADLADYRFIRVNRGKKTDPAGVGNFPSRLVPPGGRAIFYTSERYSNSKDKAVSAFAEGTFDGKPMIFEDYGNILVWGDKVNPKKSPYVRLYYAPGGTVASVVDTVVVPSDLPEGWSIIVGDAAEGEGTRRWMCPTPTRGKENTATDGLTRIGPNVGPLYEKKGQKKTDLANEFAVPVPPAVPGTDYTVTLPINAVMNPDGTFTPRTADQIASIKFVYRKDLDDTTLVTNDIDMAKKETVENWGDQYTATIPASYFPAAGHLMQWKVLITDGEGVKWTSPSFNNKDDGYEWYGTIVEPGELNSATLPTWHMFASGNHLSQMDVDKDDQDLSLVPNYARVAIYDSSTSNYYDYVRIDLRGHTSGSFTKKGHGLRFAKAHPLTMRDIVSGDDIEEIRKTSLISEFADPSYMRQMIAFWLWRKMGNLVPFDFPVRCNLNGEFYQLAFNSERFTDELIEDVYGLDKFGYGYKNVGTLNSSDTTAGDIEKKTPDDEDETNISFLRENLINPLRNNGANASHADSENGDLTKLVVEKFDLPAWINYLASARITQEMDDVWANVCAYCDDPEMKEGVRGTGTWMPLGYDFNLSFGQYYINDLSGNPLSGLSSTNDWYKSHPLYGGWTVLAHNRDGGSSMNGNNGFEAVYQSPKFRRLYLRRLRTLMDQELKEPGTSEEDTPFMAKMREMADLMRDDATSDQDKWPDDGTDNAIDVWKNATRPANMDDGIDDIWDNYVVPRREHLYVTHSVNNTDWEVGYDSDLNAGIPEAQSPIATLKANIAVANLSEEDGLFHDTEVVVIYNGNDEVVDMSGWRLAFGADFTFPAGTVCDANDNIYIVADRRAYIEDHANELTDQVIVGNATIIGTGPIVLYDADGAEVFKQVPETSELNYLRLHSFCGNTADGGDTGEWFVLTNISDSVALDLADVTVCFLKQGDDHDTTSHCHITLENKKGSGSLEPLASMRFNQADWAEKGWSKIQNNKLDIKIYDKYGSVCQSLKVTQKDYTFAYGNGGYLVCDSTGAEVGAKQWHQEPKFTVTFEAGAHGSLDGDAVQTVDWKELPVVPEVVADETSEFTGWDGDVTEPVTNDVTFTAMYLDYGREPVSANEITRLNGKVFTGNDANRAVITNYLSQIDGTRPATSPAPHTIDVLLVYDSASTDYVANTLGESLEVHGAKGVAKMNEFLIPTDLDTNFWFRLVGTYSINAEGTVENGFGKAKNSSESGWECVNDVRERLGADIVLTVVCKSDRGLGGLSFRNYPDWIRDTRAKDYMYAAVLCNYRDTMAWVHEVGHLASLYHSVSETYQDNSRYIGCGFNGITAEDGTTFGSVMGGPYGSVGFSSPNHLFHGSVYSITNDVGQWLDSTGCLNELMPYIANYCETRVPEKPALKIYPQNYAVVTNGMVMTVQYDDPEAEIHVLNSLSHEENIFNGGEAHDVQIAMMLAAGYDVAVIKDGVTNDSQTVWYVSTNVHNIAEILDCGDMVWSTSNIWSSSSYENNPKNGICYKWEPGSETYRLTGTVMLDERKTLVFHHIDEFVAGTSFIVWVDDRPAYYTKGERSSNGHWEESTILLDSGFHTIEFELSGDGSTLYLDDVSLSAFTVRFEAGEHGELTGETEQRVPYGMIPTVPNVTPFTGWNPNGWDGDTRAPVTNDVIFTALYSAIECTITWKLDEETVIDTTQVAYGTVPTHADAAKEPTAQYTYTFTGWDPELVAVIGDATYTATFSSTVNKYTATVTVPANTAITVKDANGETLEPDDGTTNEFTVDYGTVLTVEYEAVGAYVAGGVKTQSVTVNGTATVNQPEGYTNAPAVAQLVTEGVAGSYYSDLMSAFGGLMPVIDSENTYLQWLGDADADNIYGGSGFGYDSVTKRYAKAAATVGSAGYLTVQEAFDAVADVGTVILKADSNEELTLAKGITVTVHARQGETIFAYNAPAAEDSTYTVEAGETVNGETTYTARDWYSWTVTVEAENATVTGIEHGDTVSESNPAISFTVTPNTGYEVVSVTVGGVAVEDVDGDYSATLDGDTTVAVQCSPIECTITWKLDEETVIDTTQVAYGTVPTHADAAKEPTAQYTYTFTGWDPELVAVIGDATYTATFSSTVNKYTATVTVPANTAITVKDANGETLEPDDGTTNEFTVDYGTVLTVEYEAVGAYVAGGVKTQSVTVNGTATVNQPEGYTNAPAVAQLVTEGVAGSYYSDLMSAFGGLMPVIDSENTYLQWLGDADADNIYGGSGFGYDSVTKRYAKAAATVGSAGYLTVQEAFDAVADVGTVILKADSNEELTLAKGITVTVHARQGETIFAYNAPAAEDSTYTVEAGETVNGETTYTARDWYSWTVTVEAENATVTGIEHGDTVSESNPAISFTVAPDAGYEVQSVTVGETTVEAVAGVYGATLEGDTTVAVQCSPIEYTITYTETKGVNNSANPTTYTIESGEIVFAPLANVVGWNFVKWSPASISAGSTSNKTVTAQWARPTYECTINGETKTYTYGELVTFTAPEATFDELGTTQIVYLGTTYNPDGGTNFTVTITGPVSFDWDILATNYWFATAETQNGAIDAPDAGWMADGTKFTLTAVADDHYHFVGWTGDTEGYAASEGGELEVTMDRPRTIGAIFEEDPLTIGDAVEAPELNWETSVDAGWFAERTESARNGTAARSGAVGAGKMSILSLTLEGVGTLSFDWRTSCREKTDSVYLEVDGAFKRMLSGDTAWTNVVVNLGLGEHTVCWVYARGRGESAYDDAAWIDNVTWMPTPEPTLAEALGDFEWETGGDAESGWRAEYSEYAYNGNAHAIATGLVDNVSAIIGTSVSGAGRLKFVWGVSCEEYFDKFLFRVDGEVMAYVTGHTEYWEEVTVDLDDGDHVLEWEYWKDELDDPALIGANCAMLDYVRWTPAVEVPPETNDANLTAFFEWLKDHNQLGEYSSIDDAAEIMVTSRKAAGRSYTLYAEYVTGTDPDDPENEEFTANIEIVDGKPVVTFSPDTPELRATRTYTILGNKTLDDNGWEPVEEGEESNYNFFKVEVDLK